LLKNVRSWKHLLTMVKINIIKYMRNPWLCSHTSCQTIDVDSTLIVWLMLQNGFIHENFCHIQNCVWSIFLWFSNSYFSGSGAHILFKDFMENFVSRVLFYHHMLHAWAVLVKTVLYSLYKILAIISWAV